MKRAQLIRFIEGINECNIEKLKVLYEPEIDVQPQELQQEFLLLVKKTNENKASEQSLISLEFITNFIIERSSYYGIPCNELISVGADVEDRIKALEKFYQDPVAHLKGNSVEPKIIARVFKEVFLSAIRRTDLEKIKAFLKDEPDVELRVLKDISSLLKNNKAVRDCILENGCYHGIPLSKFFNLGDENVGQEIEKFYENPLLYLKNHNINVDKPVRKKIVSELISSGDMGQVEKNKSKFLSETIKTLEKHFEEKMVVPSTLHFVHHTDKPTGITGGYVAKRQSDSSVFLIKEQAATVSDASFFNEYASAGLYRRILFDRAPLIELLGKPTKGGLEPKTLRSKFLNNFKTLADLITENKLSYASFSKTDFERLVENVEGAEKLFAAILFGGEIDFKSDNIGVMEVSEQNADTTKKVFAKIDHGFSFCLGYTDPVKCMENFFSDYDRYSYSKFINVDVSKFKEAIDQILQVSDGEIERLIVANIEKLKNTPGSIKEIRFQYFDDENIDSSKTVRFENFDEVATHYVNITKKQKQAMQGISHILNIIEHIDPVTEEWKKRGWLTEKVWLNPVEWAIKNNKEIAGQDPNIFKDKTVADISHVIDQIDQKKYRPGLK
jgi:hypothetical protein